MDDLLFYLQDSRSSVGTCAMFWKLGGGYTSNLNEAELFQRDSAVRQYKCRETDLPWPQRYIDARTTKGVDCQYVDRDEAGKLAESADRFYAAYRREWDGNNLIWMAKGGAGRTADLGKAATFSAHHAAGLAVRGYDPLPADYIDRKSRRVVSVETIRHKQALREAGLNLPKIERPKRPRHAHRCEPCGRFLREVDVYTGCPNCGASNAP